MLLETFKHFKDFELLDSGAGNRLERWGRFLLVRPDPQAIWLPTLPEIEWHKADAIYKAGENNKGKWVINNKKFPTSWNITWDNITFKLKLTPFKHTGIFAEQAAQWEWLKHTTKTTKHINRRLNILNLFGYTGAASLALAANNCFVTHVDASKPTIGWARENQSLSKIPTNSIRWILDDAVKFVTREVKRGAKYDGVILDPPAFGHSPDGKTWRFEKDLPHLLSLISQILTPTYHFVLINAYATNSSPLALKNVCEDYLNSHSTLEYGELCLKQKSGRLVSTGIFARWENN